ncbi:MAG: hypothetical protein ACO3RG_02990 [Nitriliruptoraceae bacterium]
MSEWWATTSGPELEQGDLLRDLPVVRVGGVDMEGGAATVRSEVEVLDAIVVTQTCDLVDDKVGTVLVARVVGWADFVAAQVAAGNQAVRSAAFRRGLVRGDVPPLTLLHARDAAPTLPWSVVDLRELHVVERGRIDEHVARPDHRPRLRLTSPYREHFAQAFARFFMRVGLPHDAGRFEAEGAVAVSAAG